MPSHPGAQSFPTPSDDELINLAIANLLTVLSPSQIKILSDRVIEANQYDFGELHVKWFQGHPRHIEVLKSEKFSL